MASSLKAIVRINQEVVDCRLCPRLVAWREEAALNPPARFRGEEYWARPLPGFGDHNARLLIVGLAPAAHGGNRTGRIFTGDRSGDWLFRALHKAGFANQPTSEHIGDGLGLEDCYIAAVVRCAPPANKPLPTERDTCIQYLVREMDAMQNLQVVVALGSFAWDGILRALRLSGRAVPAPKPRFGHLAKVGAGNLTLIGSYHPSQQNTFTGTLTQQAFDQVFAGAKAMLTKTSKRKEER
ncbi:MAG TPA: uracil-DNA glycosylase [Actinomycetota bacterium]|nr:uracil-DNA glycosylase [Actinomycetota bacterium]